MRNHHLTAANVSRFLITTLAIPIFRPAKHLMQKAA